MKKLIDGVGVGLRSLEIVLSENAAGVVSLFGGLLPAGMAFDGMTRELGFELWLAWAGLVVIEGLNIGATSTALLLWRRGDLKRFRLALAAVIFYVLSMVAVNVLLDSGGWQHKLAKGLLSSVSVVGALVVALRMALRDDEARDQAEAAREADRLADEAALAREAEADALAYERRMAEAALVAKQEAAAERMKMKHQLEMEKIKLESSEKVSGKFPGGGKVAENFPTSENLPETYGKWRDWRKVPRAERENIANLPDADAVIWHYGVEEKTAKTWLMRAQEMKSE